MVDANSLLFVSLSHSCLDDLRFPSKPPILGILGGPGAYATLGARIFFPTPRSRRIGWQLYLGHDFPENTLNDIQNWDLTLKVHTNSTRLSARGEQRYLDEAAQHVTFRELSPPFEFMLSDYDDTVFAGSKCYHFLGTPPMAHEFVSGVLNLRRKLDIVKPPILVWEPEPRECDPRNLQDIEEAAKLVDVGSPNHLELLKMFDVELPIEADALRNTIQQMAHRLVEAGIGPQGNGILVVRASGLGCMIQSTSYDQVWLPAFYEPPILSGISVIENHPAVVDPTGAGNAFLGAFGAELGRTGNPMFAAVRGTIAASFVIEQTGLPNLGGGCGLDEQWNGEQPLERLHSYIDRLKQISPITDLGEILISK